MQYDLEIKPNQDLKPKEIGLLQGRDFQNKRKIIGPSIYLLCPKLPRCAKMIQDKNQPNCAMWWAYIFNLQFLDQVFVTLARQAIRAKFAYPSRMRWNYFWSFIFFFYTFGFFSTYVSCQTWRDITSMGFNSAQMNCPNPW